MARALANIAYGEPLLFMAGDYFSIRSPVLFKIRDTLSKVEEIKSCIDCDSLC